MSPASSPHANVASVRFAEFVLRRRWFVIFIALGVTISVFLNAFHLQFSNNYRVFFSSENPELTAFEEFQATYAKNDNFFFLVKPADGKVFTRETLASIETMTENAWRIPHVIRVDSITNFQHTRAEGDDLIVADLVKDARSLNDADLAERREIALAEPLLRDQLLTGDADVTAMNVIVNYPEKSLEEVPNSMAAARALRADIEAANPNLDIALTGVSSLNNAFAETGKNDLMTLFPIMYGVLLLMMVMALRSLWLMLATLTVIIASSMIAMGAAGFLGIALNPISASAPTIITTLAIADSIHILITMRRAMRDGMSKHDALIESIRVNFLAVSVTSLTTIVGFLALNFSDAPPFWHLGDLTAIGIAAAWALSITLLPAVVSLLPIRSSATPAAETAAETAAPRGFMIRLADWVIARYRAILIGSVAVCAGLVAMIPTIDFNDQWIEYFDNRVEFRTESDVALQHFGLYPIEFSVPAGGPGAISDPDFLKRLDMFADWLREQDKVTHVYTLTDIMKRLNLNMHGDDPSYYRLPQDRRLSAQYLLLYELSLPFGLDLNDRVNIDKSATRISATLGDVSTSDTKAFLEAAQKYIAENFPENQRAAPTSAQVMFTHIADRNIDSMLTGTTIAIFAIALIMILSLRSLSLGLLSLAPNGMPILATFGVWAILIGEVGFSVATIASVSLGVIVDDTVHFLTKYQRARRELGYSTEDAIRYAFDTVGVALFVNTVILVCGFLVLTYSAFKPNVDLGLLTTIAITFALVFDFLMLPALLLLGRRGEDQAPRPTAPATQTA